MGDALPADSHPHIQLPRSLRHIQPAGHEEKRVSRLHRAPGHRRGGSPRRAIGRDGRAGNKAIGELHLHLQRGEKGQDLLEKPRRNNLHTGGTQRRREQQGRVLEQVQARRGRLQGATAGQRARHQSDGRLRRHLSPAHNDGEQGQDLPRT